MPEFFRRKLSPHPIRLVSPGMVPRSSRLREVSLLLMEEEIAPGDCLLLQAGGFAFERMDATDGEAALAMIRDLMEHDETASARRWGNEA